jgi:hypothetical protein
MIYEEYYFLENGALCYGKDSSTLKTEAPRASETLIIASHPRRYSPSDTLPYGPRQISLWTAFVQYMNNNNNKNKHHKFF